MLLIYMFLTVTSFAGSKYDAAIRTATDAAFKQSGYEADFNRVKEASRQRLLKWAKDNSLASTAAVIGFVAPIVYYKKIRVRTGNVVFKGEATKVEAAWTLQF